MYTAAAAIGLVHSTLQVAAIIWTTFESPAVINILHGGGATLTYVMEASTRRCALSVGLSRRIGEIMRTSKLQHLLILQ